MLKLIIFDMDGLMFDTETVTLNAYLKTLKELGYEPSREQYIGFLGLNKPDILEGYRRSFGENAPVEELYEIVGKKKIEMIEEHGLPIKAGLFELLDTIERLGVPKAIASGSDLEVINGNLKRVGLENCFSNIVSTRHVKRGKPYPDVFCYICDKMGVKPEETLVLEDSENGVKAALAAGAHVINVPDLVPVSKESQENCLAVVESLDQVCPFVEELACTNAATMEQDIVHIT